MIRFVYSGTHSGGEAVTGEVSAASVEQAVEQLQADGIQVRSISVTSDPADHSVATSIDRPVPAESSARPEDAIARAVENARQWAEPLAALAQEISQARIAKELNRAAGSLRNCRSLEQLAENPRSASLLSFALQPIQSRTDIENWLERLTANLSAPGSSWKALRYPLILLAICGLFFVFLSAFVLPIFAEMYVEFGMVLPWTTQLVLRIGQGLFPWSPMALIVAVVVLTATVLAARAWRSRGLTHRWLPWLAAGGHADLRAMATLTTVVGELTALGQPLERSLRSAARGCGHLTYQMAALRVADALASNQPPTASFGKADLPPLVQRALILPAEWQPQVFRKLSQLYWDRANYGSQRFAAMLAVLSMAVVGLMIAFVAIALFAPMINLITELSA